ncbi:MAG: hypothetical protein ACAH65_10830 [Chloroflexota bacterium]
MSRVLGVAGIVGGAVLLAAFVIEIPPDLNTLRLVLFLVGAIAVIVGIQRRQASDSTAIGWAIAVIAVGATALYLLRLVLPYSPWHPFAGDNGMVFFLSGVAMWLMDAAFGLMTLRLGVVRRWGPLALAIGSALAILGIDRLGLTSEANPTIFGSLALAGLALNGLAWILLGVELFRPERLPVTPGPVRDSSREPPPVSALT